MARQIMTHHVSLCFDCGASCDSRNAHAWAHHHARHYGHRVELQQAFLVTPLVTPK